MRGFRFRARIRLGEGQAFELLGGRELLLGLEHRGAGDFGAGTGNLAARLGPVSRLVCVDASTEMLALAKAKLPAASMTPRLARTRTVSPYCRAITPETRPSDSTISACARTS